MKRKIRIALVVLFSPLIVLFPFVCYLCPIPIFFGLFIGGIMVSLKYSLSILLYDLTKEEKERAKWEIIDAIQMMFVPFFMTYEGVREFIDPPK